MQTITITKENEQGYKYFILENTTLAYPVYEEVNQDKFKMVDLGQERYQLVHGRYTTVSSALSELLDTSKRIFNIDKPNSYDAKCFNTTPVLFNIEDRNDDGVSHEELQVVSIPVDLVDDLIDVNKYNDETQINFDSPNINKIAIPEVLNNHAKLIFDDQKPVLPMWDYNSDTYFDLEFDLD